MRFSATLYASTSSHILLDKDSNFQIRAALECYLMLRKYNTYMRFYNTTWRILLSLETPGLISADGSKATYWKKADGC